MRGGHFEEVPNNVMFSINYYFAGMEQRLRGEFEVGCVQRN